MGCVSCNQSSSQSNSRLNIRPFNQILQIKLGYLRNLYHQPQARKYLSQFISEQQSQIIMKLSPSITQNLYPDDILLPEAGQISYLNATRRTIWKLFVFDTKVFDYYQINQVHKFEHKFQEKQINSTYQQKFYQIGLDIKRTFPTNSKLNRQNLQLVLRNLNLYFQGVGYTQGMNFLVGFLLLCGFSSIETYFMFIHLSFNKNFILIRNFSQGFKNVMFMISIFQEQISKNQQTVKIKQKIDQFGLTSFFYSFSWFLCYFLYSLQPKCAVLIWNFILTFSINFDINFQHNNTSFNNKIQQKSQFQVYHLNKKAKDPALYNCLLKQQGSILNILFISLQLLKHIGQQIIQIQSAQQLMKILRNQTLCQNIKPQNIILWIQNIKNKIQKNKCYSNLNWIYFIEKMKKLDKQLYQIQINDDKFKISMLNMMNGRNKNIAEKK